MIFRLTAAGSRVCAIIFSKLHHSLLTYSGDKTDRVLWLSLIARSIS
jgi:hypothetical protein